MDHALEDAYRRTLIELMSNVGSKAEYDQYRNSTQGGEHQGFMNPYQHTVPYTDALPPGYIYTNHLNQVQQNFPAGAIGYNGTQSGMAPYKK